MRLPRTRIGSEFCSKRTETLISFSALHWYGAGFNRAGHCSITRQCGADLHYCAPDAQLSVMETRWSLVPDMAASLLLRGLVRDDIARELICTARKISAEEALLMVGL
jgi:hypothetical protein